MTVSLRKKWRKKSIFIEVRNLGIESYNLISKNDANFIFWGYIVRIKVHLYCIL